MGLYPSMSVNNKLVGKQFLKVNSFWSSPFVSTWNSLPLRERRLWDISWIQMRICYMIMMWYLHKCTNEHNKRKLRATKVLWWEVPFELVFLVSLVAGLVWYSLSLLNIDLKNVIPGRQLVGVSQCFAYLVGKSDCWEISVHRSTNRTDGAKPLVASAGGCQRPCPINKHAKEFKLTNPFRDSQVFNFHCVRCHVVSRVYLQQILVIVSTLFHSFFRCCYFSTNFCMISPRMVEIWESTFVV